VAYLRELGPRRWYVQASASDGPSRVRLTRIVEGSRAKAEREGARLTVEAEAKYQRRRADTDAGPTLRDYLADWLAALQRRIAAGERAPSTYTQYRQVVAATVGLLGDVRLRELSAADLRRLEDLWRTSGRQRADPRSGSGPGLSQARVVFRRSVLRVTPPLARTLRAHLTEWQHELVFGDAEGRPFSDWRCRRALRGLMRELGIAPLTPHSMRHSYATINLAAGTPLSLVSWALGHASVNLTHSVYVHPLDEVQREAAQRFGSYIEGNDGTPHPDRK
jgi:integrase